MALCCVFSITASQAAAQARGRSGQQSAAASSISGMSLQEAQQILNISTLSPEELQKVCVCLPYRKYVHVALVFETVNLSLQWNQQFITSKSMTK